MGLFKQINSQNYWMSFSVNKKQIKRSTGTTNKKLAEKILAKFRVDIVEGRWFEKDMASQYTYEELIERFKREYMPSLEPTTSRRYKSCLTHLNKFFTGMTLNLITSDNLSTYFSNRRNEGAMPSTVNKERNLISKAFNLAIKPWKMAKVNPCNDVPREKENNEVIRWLTPEEEERLLEESQGYLSNQLPDIITLDLNTGMRQMETLSLNWRKNVDMTNKVISVYDTKNKESRSIPMNDVVYDILSKRSRVVSVSGLVFNTSEGTMISPRNLVREFYKVRKKAGIPDFRFHDLRHTFATRLVQTGVDIYTVAKLLGHKDLKSTKRYAHLNTDSLRHSVKILDNYSTFKKVEKYA